MKEFFSKAYLKDVINHELKICYKKDKYCIVIKKILNIKEPFILNEMGHDIKLLDNNYYILEYIPYGRNYFCRVFIDETSKVKEYFFQFIKEYGFENCIPYYVKSNVAYVKTEYGEKIYSVNNTISDEELELIKKKKLEFNLDYKKYLW